MTKISTYKGIKLNENKSVAIKVTHIKQSNGQDVNIRMEQYNYYHLLPGTAPTGNCMGPRN